MKRSYLVAALSGAATAGLLSASLATATVVRPAPPMALPAQTLQMTVLGAQPDHYCPHHYYFTCVTLTVGKPGTVQICITSNGKCPAPGTWTWTSQVETLKGKPTKYFIESFSPNPGNPTTQTITVTQGQSTKGRYLYVDHIMACATSCLMGNVGIAIQ